MRFHPDIHRVLGPAAAVLLGAVGLVLRRDMALVAVGAVAGLALEVAAAQLLSTLLYGASPFGPLAFGGAVTVLALVALAANALPAVRTGRVGLAHAGIVAFFCAATNVSK